MVRYLITIMAALFLLIACSSNEAGGIRLHYAWTDEEGNAVTPPKMAQLYAWAELTYAGETKTAGPVWMGDDGNILRFENLPYGPKMKLTITMRLIDAAGGDEDLLEAPPAPKAGTDNIAYRCTSQEFSLVRGKVTDVQNGCIMEPSAGIDPETGDPTIPELKVFDLDGTELPIDREATKNLEVNLCYKAPNATQVHIANLSDFTGMKSVTIPEATGGICPAGYHAYEGWKIEEPSTKTDRAQRVVYLKASDDLGAETKAASVQFFIDNKAPVIVNQSLSPTAANGTSTVVLALSFQEPVKELTLDSGDLVFKRIDDGNDPQFIQYRYLVSEHDDAEGTYSFSVTVIDQAGNEATLSLDGGLTIDRTLPDLTATIEKNDTAVESTTLYLKDADELTVSLTLTEPPKDKPRVNLGTYPLDCTQGIDTKHYDCTLTIDKDSHEEGIADLTASFEDAAGNPYAAPLKAGIRLDYTAPVLTLKKNKDTTYNKNDQILITVNSTEELSELIINTVPQSDLSVRTWDLPFDTSDGEHLVTATAKDLAGNEAIELHGSYFIDWTYPTATVSAPTPDKISGSDSTTITVSNPTETIVDLKLNGVPCTGAGPYTCTFDAPAGTGDTTETLLVSFSDEAGNTTTVTKTVYVDRTAPHMVSKLVTPTEAKEGTEIQVLVIFDEPVTNPVFSADGLDFLRADDGSDPQRYSYTYLVKGTESEQLHAVILMAEDMAGNPVADAGVGAVTIDLTTPAISGLHVCHDDTTDDPCAADETTFSAVTGYNALKISFDLSEAADDLAVELGDTDITAGNCTAFVGPSYVCTATVIDTAAGANPRMESDLAKVTTGDDAGNGDFDSKSLLYDFLPPDIPGNAFASITPPVSCPFVGSAAGKVTNGAFIRVQFPVSEPLAASQAVEVGALRGGDEIVFYWDDFESGEYLMVYAADADGLSVEGDYTFTVHLIDLYGNEALVSPSIVPTLTVDLTAPTPPDVEAADRIVYRRIPWGSDATGGVKYFSLRAGADAVDDDTVAVVAYDGDDPATDSQIGKEAVAGGTFPEMELTRSDRTEVYLAAYDDACNASAAIKVRNIEWHATMGGKEPGDYSKNPHEFLMKGFIEPKLEQGLKYLQEPLEGGISLQTQPGKSSEWDQLEESEKPSARSGHAMAYDSTHGKVVLFGGYTGGSYNDETWEWTGVNWTLLNPATKPSARFYHAMAYDNARGKVILFGGDTGSSNNETWEWDGTNWTQKNPATQPSPRSRHAMAYDSARGKVVLFGGHTGSYNNEAWEWDGTNWSQMNPATQPSARSDHAMVYDSARGKVVLFGGSTGGDETWEWDGTDWTQRNPATMPSARYGHAMVYDSVRGKIVLFGGMPFNDETWEWDGNDWIQMNPPTKPSARYEHAMAYDSDRRKVVLFGGKFGPVSNDETWEWDGTNWTQKGPATQPSPRSLHAMAYDNARGKAVLFGGNTDSRNDETWEWDGTSWTQLNPITKPSARSAHAMAYDSTRGKVILFGGHDGANKQDTWEWDGVNWIQMNPVTKPSARWGHAMAYDSARGKLVLFGGDIGGSYNDETWEWDGTNWIQMNPAAKPTARVYHAMAYDNARGKVLLFGGHDGADKRDTWEWDGTNWTQKNPAARPSPRGGHAMVYDNARGKVLLFGGFDGSYNDETWEWDGTDWSQASPATKPSARYGHAMVYDNARGKAVLFGGYFGSVRNDETWEWDGTNWFQMNPAAEPSARYGHAMAYDSSRRKVVLFGGRDHLFNNETWEWDGTDWSQASPATKPSARSAHAMAYDSARGKVVLFGGNTGSYNDETWEWDGDNWTQMNPATKPSARYGHAMVYDSARGKVVLFGGNTSPDNDETWEWDGTDWTQRNPATTPSARYGHAMAYDSVRGKIVLFGGMPFNDETWEWDGTDWSQASPATKPSVRYSHAMAYDNARGKVVLFGGNTGSRNDETWEWDGASWTQLNPITKPSARSHHAMAYDNARGKIVLFGGHTGSYNSQTWDWNSGGNDRAAQIMNIAFENSGVTDDSTVTYRSLSVFFDAGGLGDITGTPTNGVDLLTWKHDQWVTVSSNEADPDNLAPVTWETTDPIEIQMLLNSGLRKFNFAVVPSAPNGTLTDMGSIATDYAEVIVRYTISEE